MGPRSHRPLLQRRPACLTPSDFCFCEQSADALVMRDQISKEGARVAVFYLARGADQDAPAKCRRFRASYCSCPAGIKHDLHIIFKGYADDVDYEKARVLFKGLSFK